MATAPAANDPVPAVDPQAEAATRCCDCSDRWKCIRYYMNHRGGCVNYEKFLSASR